MAGFGIFLGTIGLDNLTGIPRFTFGSATLIDGPGLVPVVMGLFGIGEILANLEQPFKREIFETRIGHLLPSLRDWIECKWALVRGSVMGFFLGILPGGGAVIASFASYAIEKRFSKTPEKFGTGRSRGGWSGVCKQFCSRRGLYPYAHSWYSSQSCHGDSIGSFDHSRNSAGAFLDQGTATIILGCCDKYVYREYNAVGTQSTTDRPVGSCLADSLQHPLSSHPSILPDRFLQFENNVGDDMS
jgi:hypothetical protein